MNRHARPLLSAVASTHSRLASEAHAQTRAPHVPGVVVVTEGRGGVGARLVASASGVAVPWSESARYTGENFGGERATAYDVRVLDGQAVTPRGGAAHLPKERAR